MPGTSGSSRAGRRTQAERTAESTRRLLAAAVQLIAEKGYEATAGTEISLRAGYSRAMVNTRFGTKEALVDHLLRTAFEERILPPAPGGGTGLEMILSAFDGLALVSRTDPRLLRAVLILDFEAAAPSSTLRPRVIDWLTHLLKRLQAALEAGLRDGTIDESVDPMRASHDILRSGIGAAYAWLVMVEEPGLENAFEAVRDQVLQRHASEAGRRTFHG